MQNYLISYGSCNFLGRFVPKDSAQAFQRGNRVIVQSERGRELGTVLTQTDELALPASLKHVPGEIIGLAEQADEANAQALAEKSVAVFADARAILGDLALSLEVIDAEVICEPETYVFHVVRIGETVLQLVQETLAKRFQVPILFHDLTDRAVAGKRAEASCGREGCGGGGCGSKGGCANGTCGSGCGSSKDFPDQWRAYFAEQRAQMELRKKQALLVE
jgi:hypothetical protein